MKKEETYLYVILLPQMNDKRELGYMIKFGYTENFKQRMKNGYNAYYRCVEVLHVYKGNFSMEDESKIKQYFRDNDLVLCKDEYLKYCPEVLDFFDTYDTPEKLKEKINSLPYKLKNKMYYKVNHYLIEYIISKAYPNLTELLDLQKKWDELFKKLREYSGDNQLCYIETNYKISKEELKAYLEKKKDLFDNSSEIVRRLACEFNELGDSCKKLTMLVNLKTMEGITDHDISSFLELIQPKYKEYYVVMGPKFIKQFSCKEAEIKREWAKLKSNDNLKDKIDLEIYKTFEIGKRYTKSGIKETLNKLYKQLNYGKKAKSTDIDLYFKVKVVKFQDPSGKWVNGFEILDKR